MLTTLFLQKNKMSPFNKKKKKIPLFLLALFIIVTTFSINTEAAKVVTYNYVSRQDLKVTAHCGTGSGSLPTREIAYGDKLEILTDIRVACDFKWQGGRLSYHMMFDPIYDTCNPCLYMLRSYGLCFIYEGGQKCYKYD